MTGSAPAAARAAALPLFTDIIPADIAPATRVVAAARALLTDLERGRRIDAPALRAAMEAAFGGSDADGTWDWKTAYDACEAATVLFLRKYGPALLAKARTPAALLAMLEKIAALLPTHTRRSEESQALQQFSTPIPLGLAAVTAAGITSTDVVLEPSAGTGLLAVLAEMRGARLVLNELAETRGDLLAALFPQTPPTRFDAAQIDDHLDSSAVPSVVLMNPPFSALVHVEGRKADAALRHIASALVPDQIRDRAGGSSPSPARASPRTIHRGRRLSSACRSAGPLCSPPASTARSTPGTARRSTRASPSSTSSRRRIRGASPSPWASPPTSRRCSAGSRRTSRHGCPSRCPNPLPRARRARPPRPPRRRAGAPPSHPLRRGRRRRRPPRAPSLARTLIRALRTRSSTGRRPRAAGSPTRSTRTTACSRSASPARCRTRRGSSSPPPWPPWRRPSPATARGCRRGSSPRACSPRRSSRR